MTLTAVIGFQAGDESKGKVSDLLAESADVVVRFNGSNNAGHTLVVNGKKIVTHLVPSGCLYPHTMNVLGPSTAIDPVDLLNEIKDLQSMGYLSNESLLIDPRAYCVLPIHKELDALREKGANPIGTTKKGTGPAYSDRTARLRCRLIDVLHDQVDFQVPENVKEAVKALSRYYASAAAYVNESLDRNERVVLEGAQSVLLDIDNGYFPYVSSSQATATGALQSLRIDPRRIDSIVGVAKVYVTKVGTGPFPTEMNDENSQQYRELGQEYGATTGRPRRIGYLDLPALKLAMMSGIDCFAWMKLDVLFKMNKPLVCTHYVDNDGNKVYVAPEDIYSLSKMTPHYEELPTLSPNDLLDYLEGELSVTTLLHSVGPDRKDTVWNEDAKQYLFRS